jgi:hypothetical protein
MQLKPVQKSILDIKLEKIVKVIFQKGNFFKGDKILIELDIEISSMGSEQPFQQKNKVIDLLEMLMNCKKLSAEIEKLAKLRKEEKGDF